MPKDTQRLESVDTNQEYSPSAQKFLLDTLLSDPDSFTRVRSILDSSYFHDTLRKGVRLILSHSDQYKALPTVDMVEAHTGIPFKRVAPNSEWAIDYAEAFCRHKAIERVLLDGASLLDEGRGGEIERRLKDALAISVVSELGTNFFDDPHSIFLRMRDRSAYISTGWETLDHKLYGGFTRGALNVFAGGSGSGKSLFLQNIALNWALAGLNVCYVTLELDEDFVALRLAAMVTSVGTSDVMRDIDTASLRIKRRGAEAGAGEIRIKKLPEGGTTTNHIRAYLKEYMIKTGLKPDAVVVDYLDLLYPNNNRIDPSDQFVKDKFTSEELRGLAHEFNVLCVTASQLNRGSVQAQGEFDHSHIAGGISKINTADNVIAIHTSPQLKERGQYILVFLKTRSSGAVGEKVELGYDPMCMRIMDGLPAATSYEALKPTSKASLITEARQPPKAVTAAPEPQASPHVLDMLKSIKARTQTTQAATPDAASREVPTPIILPGAATTPADGLKATQPLAMAPAARCEPEIAPGSYADDIALDEPVFIAPPTRQHASIKPPVTAAGPLGRTEIQRSKLTESQMANRLGKLGGSST